MGLLGTQDWQTPYSSLKVTGYCSSLLVCFILAPRSTAIVLAFVATKLLLTADTENCYTLVSGCTASLGNFTKATFDATSKTYSYLTPDLSKGTVLTKAPYQQFIDHLVLHKARVFTQE